MLLQTVERINRAWAVRDGKASKGKGGKRREERKEHHSHAFSCATSLLPINTFQSSARSTKIIRFLVQLVACKKNHNN